MKQDDLIRIIEQNIICRVTTVDKTTAKAVAVDSGRLYWLSGIFALDSDKWVATVVSRDATGRIKFRSIIILYSDRDLPL